MSLAPRRAIGPPSAIPSMGIAIDNQTARRAHRNSPIMITVSKTAFILRLLTASPELSYLLHYVEENNRNHGNPWSLRQTGIYQQVKSKGHTSTWIFLKLSGSSRRQLETVTQTESTVNTDGFMKLHSCLFLATVDNWGRYIDHLDTQLRGVVCLDNQLPFFSGS